MRDWLALRRDATPDDVALIADRSGATWTYRDLDEDVDVVSSALAGLGVGPGDRVGLVMDTSPAFVRLVWAVQRRGAILVPFNAGLTADEIGDQVERVDPDVVVADADHEETAVTSADGVPVVGVATEGLDAVETLHSFGGDDVAPVDRSLTETMAVLFTSGTTGSPTAVRLTAANVLASATASAFRLGVLPSDRWLLCLPMYHMGGLSVPIRTTVYGTTTVLQEDFDAAGVLTAIEERDATGVSLVPTMLRRLLDAGMGRSSLRFALVGGGPADPDLITAARDANVPVYPTYGMTETASQVATATPAEVEDAPDTVGRPLAGVAVVVRDESGDPVPAGTVGEITVAGPTVSPDVRESGPSDGGWFATGDLGYRDGAGRLFVVGRADDQIVTGGENVAPATVRRAIEGHPAVEAAAVVGLPDPEWGERVAALVVRSGSVDADELDAYLRDRLADYQRPKTIGFATDLPRTASGTVDRDAVADRLRKVES
ncbi:MAG: class I adenylate-forming enzyme family protein [Halanaeroarchaeum sp.]